MNLSKKKEIVSSLNLSTNPDVNYSTFKEVPYAAFSITQEDIKKLTQNPNITYIFEDKVAYLQLNTNLDNIGIDDNFISDYPNATGKGQTIAILDVGFDINHSFYRDRIVYGACFSTNNTGFESMCPDGTEETNRN